MRVIRKKNDGYHELASLIQAVDLFDTLSFVKEDEDKFTCSLPFLENKSNLVLRALQLFREKTGLIFPIHIHLEKKIPIQAGLGGGSSNAATALYALNVLSNYPLSDFELRQMGAKLGSDVPFFFSSGCSYCTGRGEIFEDKDIPGSFYTLYKPFFGLSTPAVFNALELNELSQISPETLLESHKNGSPIFINDLESPAFFLEPALKAFKESILLSGPKTTLMSGSGSTFFCIGKNPLPIFADFSTTVQSIKKNKQWY